MKILYGAVVIAATTSGICAMDDAKNSNIKQTAAMSFSSKFVGAMSSSTPSLPYASSIVSPQVSASPRASLNIVTSSSITPRSRSISSPRPPSPHPSIEGFDHTKYEAAALRSFSEKKLSSSSLPTIPEKK